jgi:hypothetical protein
MRKTPFKHAHNSRGSSCGGGRAGQKEWEELLKVKN